WHASGLQSDLDARERAHEHQVVEVAKMTDAKHLARELAEARAERHIATIEDHLAQTVGVVTGGHDYGGERVAVLLRIRAQDLETPPANRPTGGFGVARVTREHVRHSLLFEHCDRLAQPEQQIRARCVREE